MTTSLTDTFRKFAAGKFWQLPAFAAQDDTKRAISYHRAVADVLTKAQRSQRMAAIRSRGNKATELKLASILRSAGITGWRRHRPLLPGRPDFVFPHQRVAVFVDGCFWHGCRWHCRMPKTRTDFWNPKIERNRKRDSEVRQLLRKRGWRVLRIWEHLLADRARTITLLRTALIPRIEKAKSHLDGNH